MGKSRAGRQHRRERRARRRAPVAAAELGRAVLARDVGVRARAAVRRLAGAYPGRGAAQGPRGREALAEDPQRLPAALGAPLWVDDSSDTGVLEVRAKARRLHHQLEDGLGLIIIDYLQLMRTRGPRREPRRAGGADLPRAEVTRPRAGRPRDRAVSAEPRGRATRRGEAADPVGSAGERARSSRTPTW